MSLKFAGHSKPSNKLEVPLTKRLLPQEESQPESFDRHHNADRHCNCQDSPVCIAGYNLPPWILLGKHIHRILPEKPMLVKPMISIQKAKIVHSPRKDQEGPPFGL
jgi:hypothetical protein